MRTMRSAEIRVVEGRLTIWFPISDEVAATGLHNLLRGQVASLPSPTYTPAKPVVAESNPDKWPKFPGQVLNYRGEPDPFSDENIHTGGPR